MDLLDLKLQNGFPYHITFDELQHEPNGKTAICGAFAEPSDGLEPSTPPYHVALVANAGNRWQRIGRFQAGFRALHASIVC
jgi:hypothetical protein